MAGERKKPTAAEKGKAILVEEKKRDKGIEAALNAVQAAERRRPGPLVIQEPPATAAESPVLRRSQRTRTAPTRTDARVTPPGSRKRARDDDVVPGPRETLDLLPPTPPPPPPIVDDYHGLFSKASQCVVTVAFDKNIGDKVVTTYRTGFIITDEENYSLVLTASRPYVGGPVDTYVYFGGENSPTKAYMLAIIAENELLILIARTDRRYEAAQFSCDPLGYEVIFTICAMSATKLSDKPNASVIKEFEGTLGMYKGTVGTPCCDALDASYAHIVGSEKYFQLSCSLHDDIITLENIDDEKHTVEITVPAPVFRLNGKIAGMLFSEGGWTDSKIGLLAKSIILCIKTYLGSDEWEEGLKKMAIDWLEENN